MFKQKLWWDVALSIILHAIIWYLKRLAYYIIVRQSSSLFCAIILIIFHETAHHRPTTSHHTPLPIQKHSPPPPQGAPSLLPGKGSWHRRCSWGRGGRGRPSWRAAVMICRVVNPLVWSVTLSMSHTYELLRCTQRHTIIMQCISNEYDTKKSLRM